MPELSLAAITAVWLGLLTAISPCPLATNIAAISFISRKIGKVRGVLIGGGLYTLGRTLTYTILGMLLVRGLTAAPTLSHALQKYMNQLMGPLLILVAMVLLDLLQLRALSATGWTERLLNRLEQRGGAGALLLGVVFALSFCPGSAAIFFGSLLPLAVHYRSALLLPALYGIATGLPVLVFALLLAFSSGKIARIYNRITQFEVWAQRVTGLIFLGLGLYMTLTLTLGITLW